MASVTNQSVSPAADAATSATNMAVTPSAVTACSTPPVNNKQNAVPPPIPPAAGASKPETAPKVAPSGGVSRRPAAPTAAVAVPVAQVITTTAGGGSSRSSSKSKKKKSQSVGMSGGSQGAQGENTGRWTAEEHRLFLQGLEQHGKGWKKIASLIKSRTVVQIRTHAQKYFQKLAKARQNGEEGDVTMEGRGGVASVLPVPGTAAAAAAAATAASKRRRQQTGTKRKAIHSVVVSAQRQGKKMAAAQVTSSVPNPIPPLPAVAPTLAHFVLPSASSNGGKNSSSITTAQGTISGPALEDSLFRFLTPAPVAPPEPQVNDVARQAGANPITVPTDNPSAAPTISGGGEVSPTGVAELAIYPSWTDAKDMPSWYAKGADVDALLDVGDSLDWLADTGDLHETYQPPSIETAPLLPDMDQSNNTKSGTGAELGQSNNSASVATMPRVDSNVETVVPPLPSLFEGPGEGEMELKDGDAEGGADDIDDADAAAAAEAAAAAAAEMDDQLQVFDTPMEEHDFVSTILESSNESSESLPVLV